MKKVLLVLTMMMGLGVAQAEPFSTAYAFVVAVNMTANSEADADLFKTVQVSHVNNPKGYSFEITKYEYKQNPSAYKLN